MVKFKSNNILLGDIVVMIGIENIKDNNEKSRITNYILRELPEWFGIEESIVEYVEEVKQYDFYGVYNQEEVIGFISIKYNNKYTAEVYLIGVLKNYQNNHIGRRLIEVAEEVLIKNKMLSKHNILQPYPLVFSLLHLYLNVYIVYIQLLMQVLLLLKIRSTLVAIF